MTKLRDLVAEARRTGDFGPLVAAIPYAGFLGIELDASGPRPAGVLRYGDHLVGNPSLPALHGGTLCALCESTAIFALLREVEPDVLPKTITLTIDYLRPARPVDTRAEATLSRQGRRVATVRVHAWQEDPARPVATATVHLLLPPPEPAREPATGA